jgi:CO/xanthine dehydrogenase FAD-binding subunit
LQEAISLIKRPTPRTVPLGGGTLLSHAGTESLEVVDLQALGLGRIDVQGNSLDVGATATLQAILEHDSCPPALRTAVKLEAPLNIRNAATIAGALVSSDGRSTLTTALLALDTKLSLINLKKASAAETSQSLGDYLPIRPAALITKLTLPLQARLAFEYVSRTPSDKPIVCVAVAQWPSGRTRLAVGGYGVAPRLAMDGTESTGLNVAARNALHEANDEWGSAEYRMDVAATLALRCLSGMSS